MSEALFSEQEVLEAQSPQGLARFVLQHSERISESERVIGLANDVLSAYGTTIDEQMDILNDTNKTTNT